MGFYNKGDFYPPRLATATKQVTINREEYAI
jgi:hypothetical protein